MQNSRSTYFDSVIFIGGPGDEYAKKLKVGRLIHAVREAYAHFKTVGATGNAVQWITDICLPGDFSPSAKTAAGIVQEHGCVLAPNPGVGVQFGEAYIENLAKHRYWARDVSHIAA